MIDGILDDPEWERAPVADGFVQVLPRPGAPASQRTEARVLYDDESIYVGIRAWDSSPDSIVGHLTRRDQNSNSDRLHVLIDSFHDRRTGFQFTVNPLGVQQDVYRYDDHLLDPGWEAVWEVATQVDCQGWTAEFRIPLSQLRFSGHPRQDWGINFGRDLARASELSVWAPYASDEPAMVSRAGVLEGLENLSPGVRAELLPYVATSVDRLPGEPDDPFHRSLGRSVAVGADLKLGLTNDFTLDLTVNPDFGQVEADPAEVNLTAFETFLPERRPFFQEGAGIFNFGLASGVGGGIDRLFYSRRIGRAPQGRVDTTADWVSRPARTRIPVAGKISGKSSGGWSLGALHALTASEEARVWANGTETGIVVEPRTHYSVLRVQRDLRGGQTVVGLIGTSTHRNRASADALGMHRDAYALGLDLRHRFRGGTMEAGAFLLGSRVSGDSAAIEDTQTSPVRYFQRPDADHVSLDPGAEALSGWAAGVGLRRIGGGSWRFGFEASARSPGLEMNDVGFLQQADYVESEMHVGYVRTDPGERLRSLAIHLSSSAQWTFGREEGVSGAGVTVEGTSVGNHSAHATLGLRRSELSPSALRGGPALRSDGLVSTTFGFLTDPRRPLRLRASGTFSRGSESGSWTAVGSPRLEWRPATSATLSAGPMFMRRSEEDEWVGRVPGVNGDHHLLGRIDQRTSSVDLRASLALSPRLSVQFHAEPFISDGAFDRFKVVEVPRARRRANRFRSIHALRGEDGLRADLEGEGELQPIPDPGFSARRFRSTGVLRWEHRPGSTLYLVWSHARNRFGEDPQFGVWEGLSGVFGPGGENVVMLKANYWLSP